MKNKNWTQKLSKGFNLAIEVGAWIGAIATSAIVLIVFIDVVGRYFFTAPLQGSYELVQQSMVILGGFAVMFAALKGAHVSIDLINSRLSKRTLIIVQGIYAFIGCATSVMLAYEVCLVGMYMVEHKQLMDNFDISTAPFMFIFAIAMLLCGITLGIQIFRPLEPIDITQVKE